MRIEKMAKNLSRLLFMLLLLPLFTQAKQFKTPKKPWRKYTQKLKGSSLEEMFLKDLLIYLPDAIPLKNFLT
jgi:hypothetical protein